MGFEEGAEDEFLLTCIVCQSPFGMVSRFCGECGANREQALGVERARPSQRVRPVEPEYRPEPQIIDRESVGSTSQTSERTYAKRPSRWANMQTNNAMRIDQIAFTLQYHGKKVIAFGLLVFLGFSYVTTQSLIFLGSAPGNSLNEYIAAVSQRDAHYFTVNSELTPNLKKFPLMPSKFNSWPESQAASWINTYSWNGWLKTGTAELTPGANQLTITLPLKPREKHILGIFRDSTWVVRGPMATVHIAYPKDQTLPIYINGIYAGTVGNPMVAPGTYYALPGPLTIKFASNGQKTKDDVDIFIDASGSFEA
jgi:hypothetical protein